MFFVYYQKKDLWNFILYDYILVFILRKQIQAWNKLIIKLTKSFRYWSSFTCILNLHANKRMSIVNEYFSDVVASIYT